MQSVLSWNRSWFFALHVGINTLDKLIVEVPTNMWTAQTVVHYQVHSRTRHYISGSVLYSDLITVLQICVLYFMKIGEAQQS